MQHHGKTDIADFLRMLLPMRCPILRCGPIHAVDTAMVLLIQAIRVQGMHRDAMWIVTKLGVFVGQKVGLNALVQRCPGLARIH